MSSSPTPQKDPSVLGTSGYERNARDFYPTPRSAFHALIQAYEDDLPSYLAWEPFCGDGAISRPLAEFVRGIVSTDIHAYEGFEADALADFFAIYRDDEPKAYDEALLQWGVEHCGKSEAEAPPLPLTMSDIEKLKGFRPDAIITNPPYGKMAERAARHALKLMEPEKGLVAFLCRHEWDCAASRADLFDHPAFAMKVTMRHRPRWIEGSAGAPRFSYAWFIWDWSKALSAPALKPEIVYVR